MSSKKAVPNNNSVVLVKHVEESIKLLEQVAALIADGQPSLTPAQRQRSAKLRKGGEKIVPILTSLATRFGVSVSSHPVGAMAEKLQLVQTLWPLLQRSQELLKQIEDVSLRAQSVTSETMGVYYSTLRHLSRKNGDIATTMAPVEEFFAYRHKSVAKHPSSKKSKQAIVPTVVVGTAPAATTAASSGTEPSASKAPAPVAVPATAPAVAIAHA